MFSCIGPGSRTTEGHFVFHMDKSMVARNIEILYGLYRSIYVSNTLHCLQFSENLKQHRKSGPFATSGSSEILPSWFFCDRAGGEIAYSSVKYFAVSYWALILCHGMMKENVLSILDENSQSVLVWDVAMERMARKTGRQGLPRSLNTNSSSLILLKQNINKTVPAVLSHHRVTARLMIASDSRCAPGFGRCGIIAPSSHIQRIWRGSLCVFST